MAPEPSKGNNAGTAHRTRPTVTRGANGFQAPPPSAIIRYNEMPAGDAETVFRNTLNKWGLADSNEEERLDILRLIATACAISTSKDDENAETQIQYGAGFLPMRDLIDNARLMVRTTNDSVLRIWTRSFRDAQIPVMIFDMLGDPSNVEIRQELARRCNGPPEHAQYMFDTSDALVKSGIQLSSDELRLFNSYRAARTSGTARPVGATADATPRGDAPRQSMPPAKAVPVVPQSTRLGFETSPNNYR